MNDDIKKIIESALRECDFKNMYSHSLKDFLNRLDNQLKIKIKKV